MKELFVPYKVAIKLKKLSFKERTVAYYESEDLKLYSDLSGWDFNTSFTTHISAPTWSQVFDWFSKKDFNFPFTFDAESGKYWFEIWKWDEVNNKHRFMYETEINYSYKEVKPACIEKLIEILENEKM